MIRAFGAHCQQQTSGERHAPNNRRYSGSQAFRRPCCLSAESVYGSFAANRVSEKSGSKRTTSATCCPPHMQRAIAGAVND
jgi:hypothetical protein